MTTADPIITAARDHAAARRDVLADIAASLPPDQLAAAAQKARADHETAREIAARLLAPPDPVDILAGVIADHGEVADERDELRAERDALTAELEAIRKEHAQATEAIEHLRERRRELKDEVDRLTTSLSTAETDAETQRTAADNLRAALDRVATAAGFGPDGAAPDVADRVIAAIRRPALPADLRTYLETRRDRLQGGHGLGLAAEIAAINRWLALPTADATGGGQ